MAIDATDWTVTRSNGNIRYIGDDHNGTAPTYATVIEFHRWLQGLADDAVASGDDELDITNTNPSERSTDNIITLINNYNIDDGAAEHLYDGTIVQGTGGSEVIYDGIVNFGAPFTQIQIIQNGAVLADDWWNYGVGGTDDTSTGAAFLTDSGEAWTTDEWVDYTILNTTDGSWGIITANTGTTITADLHGGANDNWDSGDAYLIGKPLNGDLTQGISHRFMIKVRNSGTDIDGKRLLGISRRYGRTWAEFPINGTARGNNVLALSDATDLNNTTDIDTVAGLTDVYQQRAASSATVSGVNNTGQAVLNTSDGTQFTSGDFIMIASDQAEYQIISISVNALTLNRNLEVATAGGEAIYDLVLGYNGQDVNNDTTNEFYYSLWDKGGNSINTFYERQKYMGRDTSTSYIYGIEGELFRGITHELDVDGGAGTWAEVEDISWAGGTGQLLAIDNTAGASTTKIWFQLLTGIVPIDNETITGGISTATVLADLTTGTIVARPVTPVFAGQSTGSALIGAYGFSLESADLTVNDTVFDLTNTAINPPNNVQFTVGGLISTEDRVLVGPWDGVATDPQGNPAVDKDQLSLDTLLNADNITQVEITESIPSDTPSSGTIRVTDNNGFERRLEYGNWENGTPNRFFNITTTDGNEDFATVNASVGNDVWISYVDEEASATSASFTAVYSSDRDLVVVVRDGGGTPIKEFITSAVFGNANSTTTAIRTTDA
jgi:hypothetical protein